MIVLVLVVLSLIAHGSEVSSDSTARVVSAGDILTKIQNGEPAEFHNCTVVGDLNLSSMIIAVPVHFNNAIFQNSVNFTSTTFNGDVSFWYSTFNGKASFLHSTFNGEASFYVSSLNDDASFRNSTFNGDAYFVSSAFNHQADFWFSTFNRDAYFWNSAFRSDASFGYSVFKGYALFWSSVFSSDAFFRNSVFNSDASFDDDSFDKTVNFNDAVFKRNTSIENSQFTRYALFENTVFIGELSLVRTRYDKLFVRWYNIKGGLTYDDAAYMSLMKNFKDLGYFEDYDSCYFQYRSEHRGQPWPLVSGVDKPVRKCIDFFLEWFYGYGTEPLNAFYFSVAIIIFFGIFWKAIGLGGPDDVTGRDSEVWETPEGIMDIFGFSTTVFLSGTRLFIDPPDIPKISGRSRSIIKNAFIFERILGALFSILFFLAISGTVVR